MTRVLFVSFIDFSRPAVTGSMVRPHRMFDAFVELGCHVDLIDGVQNSYSARKKAYKKARQLLSDNKYDLCYVELPSGPMFFPLDRKMLSCINAQNIPLFYYYRDCYWLFPELYYQEKGLMNRVRYWIIRYLQNKDLKLLQKTNGLTYYPTSSVLSLLNQDNTDVLPPGCDIPKERRATLASCLPTGIFVGGATLRYGIKLLLDSFIELNQAKIRSRLIIVSSLNGWNQFCMSHHFNPALYEEWLSIRHTGFGTELEEIYQQSDYALLPLQIDPYTNLALPIKTLEYCSYLKPVVATKCNEIKKFVETNEIGLLADDNVKDYHASLSKMIEMIELQPDKFQLLQDHCHRTALANTWLSRARKVLEDAEILS